MIHSLKITDAKRTAFGYIDDIIYFEGNREFEFKPGVNLIVGPNGSGKSTLLKLMRFYFGEGEERVPTAKPYFHMSYFGTEADGRTKMFYDGADVQAAFNTPVFSLHDARGNDYDVSPENIARRVYARGKSEGETVKMLFNDFFSLCFHQLNHPSEEGRFPKYVNPKKVLALEGVDDGNGMWGKAVKAQRAWYRRNNVKDKIPAFLLDEPESKLDVASRIEVGDTFAEMAGNTDVQYIMVVHDPYIIRKVADTGKANIIQLYPNYLNVIDGYFKKIGGKHETRKK